MSYKVNGTTLLLQPTKGRWVEREKIGIDGAGHPVYPAVREFQLEWGAVDVVSFNQLYAFFSALSNTGTCVVDLPKWANSSWVFYSYTGCTLEEPMFSEFFEENYLDVTMTILGIRT